MLSSPLTASTSATFDSPVVSHWLYQAQAGGIRYTQAQANAQAADASVVVGNVDSYQGLQAGMFAVNPKLTLLAYVNGAYIAPGDVGNFPTSEFLHDASGAPVRSLLFGNYLMNVLDPAWVAHVVALCKWAIATSGDQGCYVDMLGPASIASWYTTGTPLDPATGLPFTQAQWMSATTALATAVVAGEPKGVPVYANGLADGQMYFSASGPTSVLARPVAGALAEAWLRPPTVADNIYPSEAVWLQNVDMVAAMAARGKHLLLTTKTWGTGTAAQISSWHVFADATYLLAADGTASFSFLPARTADPTAPDPLLSSVALGAPTGPMTVVSGIYERTFATGLVVVNPTSASVTVDLGGTYRTLSGRQVTSLTLAADRANILAAG